MRIAVWSGPRNLSTALMYAFGNRADMTAIDEPFYGAFLRESGIDHPMAADVMRSMQCDPGDVVSNLRLFDTPHQYEKHMPHHVLAGFPLEWIGEVKNVFLLRHPARVLASYLRKREEPTAADLGFNQIETIFDRAKEISDPFVIDSAAIRSDPRTALAILCTSLGLEFDEAMLHWPQGPKPFDGLWAAHWYDAVHRSTGFDPAEGDLPHVPEKYASMIDDALDTYHRLKEQEIAV